MLLCPSAAAAAHAPGLLRYALHRMLRPRQPLAGRHSSCHSYRPSQLAFSARALATSPAAGMAEASPSSGEPAWPLPGGKPLLSVAPMMEWTDVHFRQLARLLSRRTWLWTEMVVDKTVLHTGQLDKHLWFPPSQRPLVLQLGGSDPDTLRAAAATAARYGYDEVNLNCGCPSDRVAGAGCFGAALMLQPGLVADCAAALAAGLGPGTPVSIKCRLGVDDADSYEQLAAFVAAVSGAGGVRRFVIHARKCLLRGLSPAQNRSVPPLRHEWVWSLKRDFPHLSFQLNGGVASAADVAGALALDVPGVGTRGLDGVMLGRAAYNDPWGVLADADVAVFGEPANPAASRRQVIGDYCQYADAMLGRWAVKPDGHNDPGVRVLVRPLLNLFHGERGGKRWKAAVDEALRTGSVANVSELMAATLGVLPDEVLDAPPRAAADSAAAANNWRPPAAYALARPLAAPGDRARGENERRRGSGKRPAAEPLEQQGGADGSCGCGAAAGGGAAEQQQQQTLELQQQQQQQPEQQHQEQQQLAAAVGA